MTSIGEVIMAEAVEEAIKAWDRHEKHCDTCGNHFFRHMVGDDVDFSDPSLKRPLMRCRTCLMGADGTPTNWFRNERTEMVQERVRERRGARMPGRVDPSCLKCPIHTEGRDWRGTKNRSGNLIVCHPGKKKYGCPRGHQSNLVRRYELWKRGRGLGVQ
jgi:hypothetical protein